MSGKMILPLVSIVLFAGLAIDAIPSTAQTRFSVTGGAIIPWGGFADEIDPSPVVGGRLEFQPMNILGQRRLLAFVLDGTVGILDGPPPRDPDDGDGDATLLAFGGGIRAYSSVAPFFVSGGAGWARYDAGSESAENGFDLHAGIGFLMPTGPLILEVEVALHEVVFSEDDLQHLTASAGLAFPI